MNSIEVFSHLVVFAGAFLQSATGIGFALVAGPVILILVDGHTAVQVTMALSLTVCLVLAPTLMTQVDRPMLKRLLIGTVIGLPIGVLVFWTVSLLILKVLAMFAVAFMAWIALRGLAPGEDSTNPTSGRTTDILIGVLSGAMNTALAMPGPAAAARLTALAMPKLAVRATVLLLMVISYIAALAAQAGFVGIDGETMETAAWLLPATLVGLFAGKLAVTWISEIAFRRIIAVVLVVTAIGLLTDVAQGVL